MNRFQNLLKFDTGIHKRPTKCVSSQFYIIHFSNQLRCQKIMKLHYLVNSFRTISKWSDVKLMENEMICI